MKLKKSARVESTTPPPAIKKIDQFYRIDDKTDLILDQQYWTAYRSPNVARGKLEKLIFGGVLNDVYGGLRRDEYLSRTYGLKTISFGNWVKNEDRLNFLAILAVSFYDLSILFNTKNLGKKVLTVDWGGVGQGRYKGAYFSNYDVITMPRYQRPDKYLKTLQDFGFETSGYVKRYFEKIDSPRGEMLSLNKAGKAWIMKTSGWGSFAHEFGHFIDHYIGTKKGFPTGFVTGRGVLPFYDEKKKSLLFTEIDVVSCLFNGTRKVPANKLNKIERAFFNWFVAMYFQKSPNGYKPNGQYTRLLASINNGGAWKYWGSVIECWARCWEIFVSESLSRKGITNSFLVDTHKKFGRDVRIIDGKPVAVIMEKSVYPTNAHVWQNKKVFLEIINIFVNT